MTNFYSTYGFALGDMKTILDIPLPKPFDEDDIASFSFSSLGDIHKRTPTGNKVYKYRYDSINQLKEICTLQSLETKTYKITKFIDINFRKEFNKLIPETTYAVKVIKAETYRSMISGLKEVCMNNEIFTASEDLVSKPFFSTPFWNGEAWVYVIVSEFIKGKTIKDVRALSIFTSKKQKEEIKNTIASTIHQLWWNGYSHNNLTKDNIIYDRKTKSAKLVGLRNCVALPFEEVTRFQNNISSYGVSMMREYQNTFKKQSIILAGLSGNTEKIETDDRVITAYYF
jgi:hypothetical protein